MCNCKVEIPKKAEGKCDRLMGRAVDFSEIERYGFSIIRIRPYRLDGQLSKTFLYPSVYWSFCPFCGEQTK